MYVTLFIPASIYLFRYVASGFDKTIDTVVDRQVVPDRRSYSKLMVGFEWSGWLRVYKMYLKMTLVALILWWGRAAAKQRKTADRSLHLLDKKQDLS